jgi:hypothetical protein
MYRVVKELIEIIIYFFIFEIFLLAFTITGFFLLDEYLILLIPGFLVSLIIQVVRIVVNFNGVRKNIVRKVFIIAEHVITLYVITVTLLPGFIDYPLFTVILILIKIIDFILKILFRHSEPPLFTHEFLSRVLMNSWYSIG